MSSMWGNTTKLWMIGGQCIVDSFSYSQDSE